MNPEQRLAYWQEQQELAQAYLDYTNAQIHKVRVEIGNLTVQRLRQEGQLSVH